MDKDAFLLLLVTQFKHQDPLNPMEDREFVAQLAQFSSLEQEMNSNEKLQTMIDMQTKDQMLSAASYIGKEVSARGWGVSVMDGAISEMLFAPSEELSSCTANIYDSNKNLVAVLELGSRSAGIHSLNWDGKAANGSAAPNGVYTVNISGENAAGKSVVIDTSVSGTVVGVTSSNGEQVLRLSDGRYVALSNVREVVQSSGAASGKNKVTVDAEGNASLLMYRLTENMTSGTAIVSRNGVQVASVDLGKKNAGTYVFDWDAEDADGKKVSSGDYNVSISGYNASGAAVLIDYLGSPN